MSRRGIGLFELGDDLSEFVETATTTRLLELLLLCSSNEFNPSTSNLRSRLSLFHAEGTSTLEPMRGEFRRPHFETVRRVDVRIDEFFPWGDVDSGAEEKDGGEEGVGAVGEAGMVEGGGIFGVEGSGCVEEFVFVGVIIGIGSTRRWRY